MSNEDKARMKELITQQGNLPETTKMLGMALQLGVAINGTPAKAVDWLMSVFCTFTGNFPAAPWQEMLGTIRKVASEHPESEPAQVANEVMSALDLARSTALKNASPDNNIDGTFVIE